MPSFKKVLSNEMTEIGPLEKARETVLADIQGLLHKIRAHVETEPATVQEAVELLSVVRSDVYEDINQLQHEHLILKAADWLVGQTDLSEDVTWSWNPRQTGDAFEPDLAAYSENGTRFVAEVTTSERPIGTIDSRMAHTLQKLSEIEGERFYFVRTEVMRCRAQTKVEKAGWPIAVVNLS